MIGYRLYKYTGSSTIFYNRLFVGVPVIILTLLVVMDDDIVVVGTRPTIDIVLDAVALGTKTVVLPKAFI